MKTSEKVDVIMPLLIAAQADAFAVGKTQRNREQGYNYAQMADYVEAIDPALRKHSLGIVTSVMTCENCGERTTKSGTAMRAVRVGLAVRVVEPTGQWVEISSWGEGEDTGDKGAYKAITGARKYALACLFGLVTSDDPERDHEGNGKPAASRPAATPPPASAPPVDRKALSTRLCELALKHVWRDGQEDKAKKYLGIVDWTVEEVERASVSKVQVAIAGIEGKKEGTNASAQS